jgi:hypothetical protein
MVRQTNSRAVRHSVGSAIFKDPVIILLRYCIGMPKKMDS